VGTVSAAMDNDENPIPDYTDADGPLTTTSRSSMHSQSPSVRVSASLRAHNPFTLDEVGSSAHVRSSRQSNVGSSTSSAGLLKLQTSRQYSRRRDFDAVNNEDNDSPLYGSVSLDKPAPSQSRATDSPFAMAGSNLLAEQGYAPVDVRVPSTHPQSVEESRLRAIESPTVHSRRPSNQSVASDTPQQPSGSLVSQSSRQPSPSNINTQTFTNPRADAAAEHDLAVSKSSSLGSTGGAGSRYSTIVDDDDEGEDVGDQVDLARTAEEKLEFRRQVQQQRKTADVDEENKPAHISQQRRDPKSMTPSPTLAAASSDTRADDKFTPNVSMIRSVDDSTSQFSDTGFVSNITDEFVSTGASASAARYNKSGSHANNNNSSTFTGFDLDSTLDSTETDDAGRQIPHRQGTTHASHVRERYDDQKSESKDSRDNKDSKGGSGNVSGSSNSSPVTFETNRSDRKIVNNQRIADVRHLSNDEVDDDDDIEDELSENTSNHFTPTKPPAIRYSQSGTRGGGHHPTGPGSHSKGLNSPFDAMKDNDDGSLALSDSGMMDNEVEEFTQSFESK
jgi:hypothetical protein